MENLRCHICKAYSSQISELSCDHKICHDCFYKLCLFNKNIIRLFNDETETKIALKCILCPTGRLHMSKAKILEKISSDSISQQEKNKFKICKAHDKEIKVYCLHCKTLMCPECFYSHKALPMFVSHQKSENLNPKPIRPLIGCNKHEDLHYYYYCTDCKLPLCEVCKSTEHEDHKRKYIGDFYNQKQQEVKSQLKLPYKSLKEISLKIDESDRISKSELKKQIICVKDKINTFVSNLNDLVNILDKKMEIINEEIKINNLITKILYEKLLTDLEVISDSPDLYFHYEYLSKLPKNFKLHKKHVKLEEKLEETLQGIKKLIDSNSTTYLKHPLCIRTINEEFIVSNTLNGHNGHVRSLIQLEDERIASACDDKTIRIWDTEDNFVCTDSIDGHTCNVYTLTQLRNGKIASGSSDNTIKIWDPTEEFKCIHTLEAHTGNIYSILQMKEETFLTGSADKTIKCWDPQSEYKNIYTLSGLSSGIKCLLQLKDGRLASGLDDSTITICDLRDNFKFTHTLKGHTKSVQCLIQLKDGRMVSGSVDKTIRIWNPKDYFSCVTILSVHSNAVWSVIQLDDGKLASGSGDYTIRIWDTQENFKCIHTLNGHYFGVHSLIQLKDGRLASGSGDKTLKIWE